MPMSHSLQRAARERLASGALPRVKSDSIWGGYGRGKLCSLCGEAIRSTQVEFEVPESGGEGAAALRFHIPCHEIWQIECAEMVVPVAQECTYTRV